MLLYGWTQFNITETWSDVFCIVPRKGDLCYSFRKGLCPSRVVLLLCKKYGHKFIIKRFTSGFIADHNVHRNNNFFSVA